MSLTNRRLKKLDDEEWMVIPNTNNKYEISNYGRIKSYVLNPNGVILKCGKIKGFQVVSIKVNDKNKRFCVHKLLGELWLGKPSEQHKYVTHIDSNLSNNHISNLKWLTDEELRAHYSAYFKIKYNKPSFQKVITQNKLGERDVTLLKSMLNRGVRQSVIAKLFSISEMQVTRIKRGENWGHVKA